MTWEASKKRKTFHNFVPSWATKGAKAPKKLISWFDVVLEKLDDVFSGGARQENFGDALFL